MVELEVGDYTVILNWFTLVFGKKDPQQIPLPDRSTFWKLNFLAEDKIRDEKDRLADDTDDT
tara:strand:- start:853 stop:1038 length:186 start_codon:yes stop_codon:yes gene_type:complete